MNPVILFRKDYSTQKEFEIAQDYFDVVELRSEIKPGSLVIGRYSTLPFYQELELDLKNNNSVLVNTHEQYSWIANFDWYQPLRDYTFQTWFSATEIPDIPMVVKGRTNSRKHEWNKKMFAKNKQEAINIMIELQNDSLIGPQGLVFRKYEPLLTYEIGINGLPFTDEYRIFYFRGKIISTGYYWTQAKDVNRKLPIDGEIFAEMLGDIIFKNGYSNFFVCDIARKTNGSWILVEINDGQMSGLSENDADILYYNLNVVLNDH
jgi:hypothetical protein